MITFLKFSEYLSETEKLMMMVSKFKPRAMKWFSELKPEPTTAQELLEKIMREYGQNSREMAYTRLMSSKQSKEDSVSTYWEGLNTLFSQIPILEDEHKLHHFMEGLLPHIQEKVRLAKSIYSIDDVQKFTYSAAKKIAQKAEFDTNGGGKREIIDISQVSSRHAPPSRGYEEIQLLKATLKEEIVASIREEQNQGNAYFHGNCKVCGKNGHKGSDCWSKMKCEKCGLVGHPKERCRRNFQSGSEIKRNGNFPNLSYKRADKDKERKSGNGEQGQGFM